VIKKKLDIKICIFGGK